MAVSARFVFSARQNGNATSIGKGSEISRFGKDASLFFGRDIVEKDKFHERGREGVPEESPLTHATTDAITPDGLRFRRFGHVTSLADAHMRGQRLPITGAGISARQGVED